MYNHSLSSLNVLFTDACQNVLGYISEIGTHFNLPVVCYQKHNKTIHFFIVLFNLDFIY